MSNHFHMVIDTPEPNLVSGMKWLLMRVGWKEKSLAASPKGAPEKVAIARRTRQETTMSLKWIVERLHMGGWKHIANKLTSTQPDERHSKTQD